MQQTCRQCAANFEITDDDLKFYESISPIFNDKKELIPPPTLCPDCRLQHRTMFRNERFLYHRKSDLSGKEIVAAYTSESPYKVYDQDEWWGDGWDPLAYGRDFDFSKTLTEQLKELSLVVPRPSLATTAASNVNSRYTNYSLNLKNCYLVFGCTNGEDNMYGRFVIHSKNCVDCLSVYSCEFCYETIASEKCYHCLYTVSSKNCSNSMFLEDCIGCRNCTMCFGLRNKEYCILNKQYSQEEYEKWHTHLLPLTAETIESLRQQFKQLTRTLPHRYAFITASEECTGDMISASKNCKHSFDITDGEDSKYLCFLPKGKNAYDATFCSPGGAQQSVNICSATAAYSCMSVFLCWDCSNVYYIMTCVNSSNLFACVGLNHKQYCILNKQYTKEEYDALVPKIIEHMRSTGEWGEYLAPSLSTFPYNETVAQEEFPLAKEEVEKRGWVWHERAEEISGDAQQSVIHCKVSGRAFRPVKQELEFYQTMQLPLPELHPDERHFARLRQRNKRRLFERDCAKCGKHLQTSYSPKNPTIVYCDDCYMKTVY